MGGAVPVRTLVSVRDTGSSSTPPRCGCLCLGYFFFWLLIIRGVKTMVVSLPLWGIQCVSLVLVQAAPTTWMVNWAALFETAVSTDPDRTRVS